MKTEKLLIGQLSAEEIKDLKAKHGELNAVSTAGHIAYFRGVMRNDVNIASGQIDKDTTMDFHYYVMKECMVGGSDAILENDRFYLSSLPILKTLVDGEKAELVKL